MQLAGAVGGEHDDRRRGRGDGAELGDRHLPGRQHLEQERLELVVGPVDLVDEQHRRGARAARAAPAGRAGTARRTGPSRPRATSRAAPSTASSGPQVQDLAGEVPVVERLGGVDALVALQPDQRQVQRLGERLGQGGLAGARLALQEQRPAEARARASRPWPARRRRGSRSRRARSVRSCAEPNVVRGSMAPASLDDVPIRKETPQPVCRCRTQKFGEHAGYCLRGIRRSASPAGARRIGAGLTDRPLSPRRKVLGGVEVAAGREVAALDQPVGRGAEVVTGAAVAAGGGAHRRPSGRGRSPPGGRARRRMPPAPVPLARHQRRRPALAT